MTRTVSRQFRTAARVAFYGVLLTTIALPILWAAAAFFGPNSPSEFEQLPAEEAIAHGIGWPDTVSIDDVQTVSYKYESGMDNYSAWFQIQLTPKAAEAWMTSMHNKRKDWASIHSGDSTAGYEGVQRPIVGQPPQRRVSSRTPHWWTPPSTGFTATEAMLWYRGESGVGSGTYTAFDQKTGMLWIYDYSRQHEILWKRGEVPQGESFSRFRDDR